MPGHTSVLCVDDHVLGLAVRKAMLESRDFRVFTAENGPAGLQIADREAIDVVILDYRMPEMDGGKVAEELHRKHPEIPILLLSGFPSQIPQSLLERVDGFVAKGTSPEGLLLEVERVTSAARQGSGESASGQAYVRKQVRESLTVIARSRLPLSRCQQKHGRR